MENTKPWSIKIDCLGMAILVLAVTSGAATIINVVKTPKHTS